MEEKPRLFVLTEEEIGIFAEIIHMRQLAKVERKKETSLDQAIAMYTFSKIMGGTYFVEYKCANCTR